ncbi:hypothetical protein Cadr_000024828 [Camelus dromedarius]|uniref:Uncharacterized protein n=1 Tax=Camelus dromedarius TaxID=9838 RepID=A0A5N4CPP8_CAMDR|nr:hypothetical protein Cadr_000024828 [Camelus dromedarius]
MHAGGSVCEHGRGNGETGEEDASSLSGWGGDGDGESDVSRSPTRLREPVGLCSWAAYESIGWSSRTVVLLTREEGGGGKARLKLKTERGAREEP